MREEHARKNTDVITASTPASRRGLHACNTSQPTWLWRAEKARGKDKGRKLPDLLIACSLPRLSPCFKAFSFNQSYGLSFVASGGLENFSCDKAQTAYLSPAVKFPPFWWKWLSWLQSYSIPSCRRPPRSRIRDHVPWDR